MPRNLKKKPKNQIKEKNDMSVPEKTLVKTIQWFPGHMAKAKREISESLSAVDIAIEICDARIPLSSRNPDLKTLLCGKPSLLLMNKSSLADPNVNALWKKHFTEAGENVIFTDSISGSGISDIVPAVREILSEKLAAFERKGMVGRLPRAVILGITNAGKSTLVNKLYGTKKAKAEDRPGVTRENQWVTVKNSIELLDTPGILWPKFNDENIGLNLAFTGAIRDEILDTEEIAVNLCQKLCVLYPELLAERYKLLPADLEDLMPYEIFELIGRKRGFLVSSGEIDSLRTATMLLDEFRAGKIGRISLERP